MRGIIVIDDKAIEEKVRLIEDKLVEVHKLAHEIGQAVIPIIQFTWEKKITKKYSCLLWRVRDLVYSSI